MDARIKIEYITNLNKKEFIMHENYFDWIDENNNKWSKYNYTKIQAIEKSKTLRNCINCNNCENCKNCEKCKDGINIKAYKKLK